jgi:Tripartite tricarboxylate transporter TctB family
MTLQRDHIAGAFFIAVGALVLALSGDLPVGSMSFPGAGMVPKLVAGIIVVFGALLLIGARSGPAIGTIDWNDLPHAARVLAVAIPAVALYATAGFLLTMSVMLFCLLFVIEKKPLLVSAAFSIGVTGLAWVLFGTFLKSPLPTGILGY